MRITKAALFDAAKRWEAGAVRVIVTAVPALAKATDPKGRTALHIACAVDPKSGKLAEKPAERDGTKTAAALLSAGAELEAVVPMDEDEGDFRANPLWYAAARGRNLPLVRFLLKQGADPSYSLWTAVFANDAALMRALLAANPRLNLVSHGETPIFYAARLKRLKVLALLIEAGADPSIKDPQGRDAVDVARARRLPKPLIEQLAALKAGR
jgi:ankyrin repeat protein